MSGVAPGEGAEAGPVLATPRLLLRLAGRADVPAIVGHLEENWAHLAPSFPAPPREFLTAAYWEARVEASREEAARGGSLRLFVFPREEPGRVVGMVSFTDVSRGAAHSCALGYGLAAAEQGKGLMGEAVGAGIAHVFRAMNLHRVTATYAAHNLRSGALLKRLGFTVEGYARDYLRVGGRWEDHVLAALLNPAWRAGDPPP